MGTPSRRNGNSVKKEKRTPSRRRRELRREGEGKVVRLACFEIHPTSISVFVVSELSLKQRTVPSLVWQSVEGLSVICEERERGEKARMRKGKQETEKTETEERKRESRKSALSPRE